MNQAPPPPFYGNSESAFITKRTATLMMILIGVMTFNMLISFISDFLDLELYNYEAWSYFRFLIGWTYQIIPLLIIMKAKNQTLRILGIICCSVIWLAFAIEFVYYKFFYVPETFQF